MKKKAKKRVVLVFDDLNRSQLDWGKFVGTINEYCENKGFTTIVIGDMEAIRANPKFDTMLYKTVKEKNNRPHGTVSPGLSKGRGKDS